MQQMLMISARGRAKLHGAPAVCVTVGGGIMPRGSSPPDTSEEALLNLSAVEHTVIAVQIAIPGPLVRIPAAGQTPRKQCPWPHPWNCGGPRTEEEPLKRWVLLPGAYSAAGEPAEGSWPVPGENQYCGCDGSCHGTWQACAHRRSARPGRPHCHMWRSLLCPHCSSVIMSEADS